MNIEDFKCPENTSTFIEQKPDDTVIMKCEEKETTNLSIIVFLILFFGWLFMLLGR